MGTINRRFKKEEVFYLAKEVKKFLKIIEGTSIDATDKYILKSIESQKNKLEQILISFEPTVYEEYSEKVKIAYKKMNVSRKEYDRVVGKKCYVEVIEKAKENHKEAVIEYERVKIYRDKLKEELERIV